MLSSLPIVFNLPIAVYNDLRHKFAHLTSMHASDYQSMLSSFYSVIHAPDFIDIYIPTTIAVLDKLCISANDVLIQKRPTARVQLPNETTVPYHIDKWSGHPDRMLNIWIPLTPVYETTSLHLIASEISSDLITKVECGDLALVDLSLKAARLAKPYIIEPGCALIFSNAFLHGSIPSIEPQPRLSLDFRIALDPSSLGNKKRNIDYCSVADLALAYDAIHEAHSVVYSANTYRNLGHSSQRSAINDFAIQKKFRIISEASEFIGCKNTPQIEEYLALSDSRFILCFSVNCFSSEQIARLKNKPHSQQNRIYFALEGLSLAELLN